MKWRRIDKYHQKSDCGQWIINKTGGPNPVYMLVRLPGEIVEVGTLRKCEAAATSRR